MQGAYMQYEYVWHHVDGTGLRASMEGVVQKLNEGWQIANIFVAQCTYPKTVIILRRPKQ